MQGASIFHLARGLHRRKFFSTRDILGAAWKQTYFRVVGVEDPEHVADARNSALGFIAGHTVRELRRSARRSSTRGCSPHLAGTRALAQMHLDQGQRVWLVTAAPIEIASIIARRLGLTGAMGTVAEHEDGVYTGRLVGDMLHGPARPRRSGPSPPGRARPQRCSAYSDSFNDLPMLSLVGNPIAMNPDGSCVRTPRRRAGGSATPHRPQGRPGRSCGGRRGGRTERRAAGDAVTRTTALTTGSRRPCSDDHPPWTTRWPRPGNGSSRVMWENDLSGGLDALGAPWRWRCRPTL